MQNAILFFAAFFFVLEFYIYQAFKTLTENPVARTVYWVITGAVYLFFIYGLMTFRRPGRDSHRLQLLMSLFLIFMVPKLLTLIFLLTDDVIRLAQHFLKSGNSAGSFYPARRKFFSISGLAAAGILSALVIDGIVFGKYRYRVRKVKLKIRNLPESFRGYRIVQISDVHSGSFEHPEKLQHAIDLINSQNADLVLFTGDMVNNYADEFVPFIQLFQSIKARDGKFSVLGNHDYGDYGHWESANEKAQNIPRLQAMEKLAGFTMLRNENVAIEKNGDKLYILGVENWGEKPFPQYGDLDRAAAGVPPQAAKILMSHDPTHFDYHVKKHPADVQLTLSGHTHGMQFGLDLKNVRWSPVQYRYKKWADLYESNGKYLYVNRGFGVLAYPGRVGINPEITVFELG